MWEEHFDSLLPLVKEYVVDVWEARKIKLYGDDSSQSQSSTGDLGEFTGIVGKSGKNMCQGGKPDTGKFHSSYIGMTFNSVLTSLKSSLNNLFIKINLVSYYMKSVQS